jgi:hypothetical protein
MKICRLATLSGTSRHYCQTNTLQVFMFESQSMASKGSIFAANEASMAASIN